MAWSPLRCCTSIIRSSALVQASSSLSMVHTRAWPQPHPQQSSIFAMVFAGFFDLVTGLQAASFSKKCEFERLRRMPIVVSHEQLRHHPSARPSRSQNSCPHALPPPRSSAASGPTPATPMDGPGPVDDSFSLPNDNIFSGSHYIMPHNVSYAHMLPTPLQSTWSKYLKNSWAIHFFYR